LLPLLLYFLSSFPFSLSPRSSTSFSLIGTGLLHFKINISACGANSWHLPSPQSHLPSQHRHTPDSPPTSINGAFGEAAFKFLQQNRSPDEVTTKQLQGSSAMNLVGHGSEDFEKGNSRYEITPRRVKQNLPTQQI
jgi:hypothetical protein